MSYSNQYGYLDPNSGELIAYPTNPTNPTPTTSSIPAVQQYSSPIGPTQPVYQNQYGYLDPNSGALVQTAPTPSQVQPANVLADYSIATPVKQASPNVLQSYSPSGEIATSIISYSNAPPPASSFLTPAPSLQVSQVSRNLGLGGTDYSYSNPDFSAMVGVEQTRIQTFTPLPATSKPGQGLIDYGENFGLSFAGIGAGMGAIGDVFTGGKSGVTELNQVINTKAPPTVESAFIQSFIQPGGSRQLINQIGANPEYALESLAGTGLSLFAPGAAVKGITEGTSAIRLAYDVRAARSALSPIGDLYTVDTEPVIGRSSGFAPIESSQPPTYAASLLGPRQQTTTSQQVKAMLQNFVNPGPSKQPFINVGTESSEAPFAVGKFLGGGNIEAFYREQNPTKLLGPASQAPAYGESQALNLQEGTDKGQFNPLTGLIGSEVPETKTVASSQIMKISDLKNILQQGPLGEALLRGKSINNFGLDVQIPIESERIGTPQYRPFNFGSTATENAGAETSSVLEQNFNTKETIASSGLLETPKTETPFRATLSPVSFGQYQGTAFKGFGFGGETGYGRGVKLEETETFINYPPGQKAPQSPRQSQENLPNLSNLIGQQSSSRQSQSPFSGLTQGQTPRQDSGVSNILRSLTGESATSKTSQSLSVSDILKSLTGETTAVRTKNDTLTTTEVTQQQIFKPLFTQKTPTPNKPTASNTFKFPYFDRNPTRQRKQSKGKRTRLDEKMFPRIDIIKNAFGAGLAKQLDKALGKE